MAGGRVLAGEIETGRNGGGLHMEEDFEGDRDRVRRGVAELLLIRVGGETRSGRGIATDLDEDLEGDLCLLQSEVRTGAGGAE